MIHAWTIKDANGELKLRFVRSDRFAVKKLVLPIHYDQARFVTDGDYRREFDSHHQAVLDRQDWRIVRITLSESLQARDPGLTANGAF